RSTSANLPPLLTPCILRRAPPISTPFPYTTLFRSPPRRRGASRCGGRRRCSRERAGLRQRFLGNRAACRRGRSSLRSARPLHRRSEEHTSELQSRVDLVCRLLLEKKNRSYSSLASA